MTLPSTAVALGFFILAGLASGFRWRSPTPAQWTKLSAIGAISYGLYVIHFPILFAAKEWFPGSWTAVLVAVPASFAAAAMLEGVQPGIRRWLLSPKGRAAALMVITSSAPRRGSVRIGQNSG